MIRMLALLVVSLVVVAFVTVATENAAAVAAALAAMFAIELAVAARLVRGRRARVAAAAAALATALVWYALVIPLSFRGGRCFVERADLVCPGIADAEALILVLAIGVPLALVAGLAAARVLHRRHA